METLMRAYHDLGGQPAGPIDRSQHQYAPWEKRVRSATCAPPITFGARPASLNGFLTFFPIRRKKLTGVAVYRASGCTESAFRRRKFGPITMVRRKIPWMSSFTTTGSNSAARRE